MREIDTPFPYASPLQPTAAASGAPPYPAALQVRLPLEARIMGSGDTWRLRLPLRADKISREKRTVVAEEVVVRRVTTEHVVPVTAVLRREDPRVRAEGALAVTPLPRGAVAA